MTPLFKKLNLGTHRTMLVVNAPDSFEKELQALEEVVIDRLPEQLEQFHFAIVFASTLAEVETVAGWLGKASTDAILWICYPKGSSKRYQCEFHRNTGWAALGAVGWEPVRQVAVDEDWSALRFRKLENIAKFTRSEENAISEGGKAKARQRKPAGTKRKHDTGQTG
ncbi:MAG: hypothetical protein R3B84_21065 [Zavarzinella sp.]